MKTPFTNYQSSSPAPCATAPMTIGAIGGTRLERAGVRPLLTYLLLLCSLAATGQQLHIDSTRFITGSRPGTGITYAIPTADKGILFVGDDFNNPGGIIPYFSVDTSDNNNVLVGKIDSNQKISWIKVYGGSQADEAISACQTSDGGYAVLAGTVSYDGDVTGYRGGGGDLWLLRLDASGNLLWEKTYGSTAQDAPASIANTPDGGFIMLGITNGSDNDVPFHYGGFYTFDWLVIKTDGAGNMQWSKDIGGTGDENYYGSILAIDNSYYIMSSTNSTDHDCTDTVWHAGVNTGDDYHVLKIDNTGNVLWDSSYGGTGTDRPYDALFDTRDSTIVMTGYTSSSDYMVTGYQGGGDMWVVKVNKNGNLIWQKPLGGPQQEGGSGICSRSEGGYMAYGTTYPGPIGDGDCWVFALDNAGNEVTNKIFGGIDVEQHIYSVLPYLNGYAVTGISASTVFTEGSTNGRNCIGEDGFITYIDTSSHEGINVLNTAGNAIKIFPNPAMNNIKIIVSGNEKGTFSIINSMGQEVYSRVTNGQQIDMDISEWNAGIYCILWQGESGKVVTAKLAKE